MAARQELRGRSTARGAKEQWRPLLQEATAALIRQEAGERARREPEQAQHGPCEAAKERGSQQSAGRSTRGAEAVHSTRGDSMVVVRSMRGAEAVRSIARIKLSSWRGRRSRARRAVGVAAPPLHQTHPCCCCPNGGGGSHAPLPH